MQNTIVLPHLGASTAEAEDNCAIMATLQMKDYLENGNIKNSVNYPACDMGPAPAQGGRVAVLHANVPDMLSQITGVFGEVGANIDNLTNKARGNAAYTMLDLNAPATDELARQAHGHRRRSPRPYREVTNATPIASRKRDRFARCGVGPFFRHAPSRSMPPRTKNGFSSKSAPAI